MISGSDIPDDENEELNKKILLKKNLHDDHCYWSKKRTTGKQEQAVRNQNQWNKIARQTKMEQEMRGGETTDGEDLFLAQAAAEKTEEEAILQRFSVLREEIGGSEEFDLKLLYLWIEIIWKYAADGAVLRVVEVKKIREFVIAIDTSYSTSGNLVGTVF